MGYVVPAGFSRVSITLPAQSPMGSEIVFGFGCDVAPGSGLLDEVQEWVQDEYVLRLCNTYSVSLIEARNDVSVESRPLALQGGRTDDPSPPNLAALCVVGTGLVGRQYHGRIFLPGVLADEDVDNTGTIDTDILVSIQNMMDALSVHLNAISGSVFILHSGVGAPTAATSANIHPIAATQRRRLRR